MFTFTKSRHIKLDILPMRILLSDCKNFHEGLRLFYRQAVREKTTMMEFIGTPIGLIINHYSELVSVMEDPESKKTTILQAKFIEIVFCVVEDETGEEFYSIANTYSMN
jgi:hypothetical protein